MFDARFIIVLIGTPIFPIDNPSYLFVCQNMCRWVKKIGFSFLLKPLLVLQWSGLDFPRFARKIIRTPARSLLKAFAPLRGTGIFIFSLMNASIQRSEIKMPLRLRRKGFVNRIGQISNRFMDDLRLFAALIAWKSKYLAFYMSVIKFLTYRFAHWYLNT